MPAQERPTYLLPRAFVTTGKAIEVQLLSEQKQLKWADAAIRWVFVKTAQVQENRDSATDFLDAKGVLRAPLPAEGPAMIGVDWKPVDETWSGRQLQALGATSVAQNGSYTVRHFQSAITIVRPAADQGQPSAIPVAESGLAMDIHALFDPSRLQLGSDLPFEVSLRGEEVEEATLRATHLQSGQKFSLRLRDGRQERFTPARSGVWLIECQLLRESPSPEGPRFEFYSGTLTFSIPGGERK